MYTNPLVGKSLTGVKIEADKQALLFQTSEGDITAWCEADCCSYTWVEHISMLVRDFPALVVSADDIEMPDLGDMLERDCVAYYGFKIVTDKGEILIDYRNDSNGYYGGSLFWPTDIHYGGVYGQNVSKKVWEDVA